MRSPGGSTVVTNVSFERKPSTKPLALGPVASQSVHSLVPSRSKTNGSGAAADVVRPKRAGTESEATEDALRTQNGDIAGRREYADSDIDRSSGDDVVGSIPPSAPDNNRYLSTQL